MSIHVLVKEVGEVWEDRQLDKARNLEEMQAIVGGYVDCVRLPHRIDLWINDEGLIHELPINLVTAKGREIVHHIAGNVLFASHDDEGETVSLSDDQIDWIRARLRPSRAVNQEGSMVFVLMLE